MSKPSAKLHVIQDFDDWAIVSARLMKVNEDDAAGVLDRLEITQSEWKEACGSWSTALTANVISGDGKLSGRYASYFSVERKRRDEGQPDPTAAELLSWKKPGLTPIRSAKVDFRHDAMHGGPQEDPADSSLTTLVRADGDTLDESAAAIRAQRDGCFIEDLSPAGRVPRPPASSQQVTTKPIEPCVVEDLRRAGETARWTVQQYAQYCADLATQRDKTEFVRARYGLATESLHRHLSHEWKQKFAQDPALHTKWAKLVAAYMKRSG